MSCARSVYKLHLKTNTCQESTLPSAAAVWCPLQPPSPREPTDHRGLAKINVAKIANVENRGGTPCFPKTELCSLAGKVRRPGRPQSCDLYFCITFSRAMEARQLETSSFVAFICRQAGKLSIKSDAVVES